MHRLLYSRSSDTWGFKSLGHKPQDSVSDRECRSAIRHHRSTWQSGHVAPPTVRGSHTRPAAQLAKLRIAALAAAASTGQPLRRAVRFGPDGPPVVTDGLSWEGRESMGGCAEFNVAERALVETTPDQTPRPPFPAPQAA